MRGGVAVTCNSCFYVSSLYTSVHMPQVEGKCVAVTGGAGKPIGLMHSFIGNCQVPSAVRASFVRLTEIALRRDVSLCLWHTHQQTSASGLKNCAADVTETRRKI